MTDVDYDKIIENDFENNLKKSYNFKTIVEQEMYEGKKYGFYLLTRK